MTGQDVYMEICDQATALGYQEKPPTGVQLGHAQIAALETLENLPHVGDTLRVQVSLRPGVGPRTPFGAYDSSAADFVTLHVERMNEPDRLRVISAPVD